MNLVDNVVTTCPAELLVEHFEIVLSFYCCNLRLESSRDERAEAG
jgi:hypothetical protein